MLKKISRRVLLLLLPPIGAALIWLLYRLNKKEFHLDPSVSDKPAIFAVWHGDLLMLGQLYRKYRERVHGKVLISDHFDGLVISRTIRYFGFETIAGSTNRKAIKALLLSIKALKEGYDIGITPDGPKGPRHKVSDGVVVMAQKAHVDIVLVEIVPTRYWQFSSWDHFRIPKPFGTLKFYTKRVDVTGIPIEEAKKIVTKGLSEHES